MIDPLPIPIEIMQFQHPMLSPSYVCPKHPYSNLFQHSISYHPAGHPLSRRFNQARNRLTCYQLSLHFTYLFI